MTSMRYGPVQLSSPPGFQNILRLISQEVLRVQPKNTLKFIAEFSRDLLEIREKTGYDPVMQGDMIERVKEQYHKMSYDRQHSLVEAAVPAPSEQLTLSEASPPRADQLQNVSQTSLNDVSEAIKTDMVTMMIKDDKTDDVDAKDEEFYQASEEIPEEQVENQTDIVEDAAPSTDVEEVDQGQVDGDE